MDRIFGFVAGMAVAAGLALAGPSFAASEPVVIPPPAIDLAETGEAAVVVLAGGCFWGVQGVFQHTEGVISAVSGYAGGTLVDPDYRQVTTGTTGHAESVEVTYDPRVVSYGKLLQIFFSVVHDPTQLNRQGPDIGTHYRSAIFATTPEQADAAAAYVAELDAVGVYPAPIVTEIAPLADFYPAEDYHQDYVTLHPDQPYVFFHDLPKIADLKAMFPELWREEPRLVFAENAS